MRWERRLLAMTACCTRRSTPTTATSSRRGVMGSRRRSPERATPCRPPWRRRRPLLAERWPAGMSISVRMGLHSGEADERENGYFGVGGEPGSAHHVGGARRPDPDVSRDGEPGRRSIGGGDAPGGLAPSAGGERTRRRGHGPRRRRRPEHDPTACRRRRGQPAPAGDGVRGRSSRAAPPSGWPVGAAGW